MPCIKGGISQEGTLYKKKKISLVNEVLGIDLQAIA
jgi:hypothetical protein